MSGIIDAILKSLGGESRGQVTAEDAQAPHLIATSHPHKPSSHEMHPLAQPFHPRSQTGPSHVPKDIDTDDHPVLMSPVRRPSSRSHASHSTPHDSSVETGNISSLSAIDLSFGPQSVPFVFLRRKDGTNPISPAEPPTLISREFKRNDILSNSRVPNNTPNVIMHSFEGGEVYDSDSEPEDEVVTPKEMEMSQWRKDQLKFMKPPRLAKGTVLMAIPTFHGPNNLPYARNPSGADAAIPDDSRLSHVFDGRPTPQAPQPMSFAQIRPHTVYINSQIRHPERLVDGHGPQEDLLVFGQEYHVQPMVSQSVSHSPARGQPHSLASSVNSTQSAPIPCASAIFRAQLGPSMQKLDTIPGSPSVVSGNPIDDFFRAMTVQAQDYHTASPLAGSQFGGSQKENIPPPKTQGARAVPQGPVEGVNFGITPRIPSNETTQSSQSGTGTHSTSRTTISVPMTPAHGKADKSDNWRDRASELESGLPSVIVTSPNESTIPLHAIGSPVKEDVMTIDSLFEKFSNKIVLDPNSSITFNPPTPVKSTKESARLPLPPNPSVGTPPPRAPLGEASGQNVSDSEPATSGKSPKSKKSPAKKDRIAAVKAVAPGSKGTPNAGKLLKKAKGLVVMGKVEGEHEGAAEEKHERPTAKAKGKGKAKAGPSKTEEQVVRA